MASQVCPSVGSVAMFTTQISSRQRPPACDKKIHCSWMAATVIKIAAAHSIKDNLRRKNSLMGSIRSFGLASLAAVSFIDEQPAICRFGGGRKFAGQP